MSFKYTASYYDKLISFMNNINNNINWSEALKDIITLPVNKFFKTYLWTDKDITAESMDPVVKNTYMYYMRWFYKLYDLLFDQNCGIVIIAGSDNQSMSDALLNKLKIKTNVLTSILSSYQLDFTMFTGQNFDQIQHYASSYKRLLLFPVSTLAYNAPNAILSHIVSACSCKVDIIDDGYYNTYSSAQELEFNLIRLLIIELVNDPAIPTDELLKNKYGMLKIEPSQQLITLNTDV